MPFYRMFILFSFISLLTPSAYAHYFWGCDYNRHLQIVTVQSDPAHPAPDLKLMSSLNDSMGTGFAYFGTSSTKNSINVVAHCWEADIFEPLYVATRDGDKSHGTLKFTVGSSSDPKDQVDVLVYIHLPFLAGYRTSVVALPSITSRYRLMNPSKNISGDSGAIPLAFMAMPS